jgi:hypothetical protein
MKNIYNISSGAYKSRIPNEMYRIKVKHTFKSLFSERNFPIEFTLISIVPILIYIT